MKPSRRKDHNEEAQFAVDAFFSLIFETVCVSVCVSVTQNVVDEKEESSRERQETTNTTPFLYGPTLLNVSKMEIPCWHLHR